MHPNLARQRLLQPGQAAQQGGFARAIGADQRGDAAACNVQANAIQGPMAGVFKDQIRDVDHTVLQRGGTAICGRIAAFCPLAGLLFVGVGSSKLMAEYGALYFSSLFLMSIHIDDLFNHPLYYLSNQVSKKSCLFIVSVDGENKEIIKNIHHLKMQNIKVISITNSAKSTIARLSDANISYYINKEQFQEANITSQLPALYTIELVGKEMRKQLNRTKDSIGNDLF